MNLIKRSLAIDTDTPLSQILEIVKPIEVESCSQGEEQVILNFCDYISLYIAYQNLKDKNIGRLRVRKLPPITKNLQLAFYSGANRSIYLTDLDEDMNEDFFMSIVNKNDVESIKFFSDNKVVNIHFFGIEKCIENAQKILEHPKVANKNKGFTKIKNLDKNIYSYDTKVRTVYIGNLSSDINPFDILRFVKGGPIFGLKVLTERKCGFVTFLNPYAASTFIANCVDEPITINGHRLKVTVGNNSIISLSAIYRIYNGSTRVIKIFDFKEEMIELFENEVYEIEKINETENVKVHFLSINKANEISGKLISKGVRVEYSDDPCGKIDYKEILINMQQKEYKKYFYNLKKNDLEGVN
ncbi:Meiotically up-regulated 24 protein [Dictyocoela muelleri]|nr:Meiotically up-regulated 24 protein [Dictyocoela muelleri]